MGSLTNGLGTWQMMDWSCSSASDTVFITGGDTIYASGVGYDRVKEAVKEPKSEVDLLDERVRKVCKAGRL